MLSEDDAPPSYELDEGHPLPVYSTHARSTECLLQLEAPRITGCPACEWIYDTKHMRINLGSRIWGLHAPGYGFNGRVEGLVKVSGDRDRVESITVSLEARLRTTLAQRGSMSGDSAVPLLTHNITIYDTTMANTFQWDEDHPFSITIPPETSFRGRKVAMPPSFFSYHQNTCCEISYSIRFLMIRKGKSLKRTESKVIPILYLPKSRPKAPPLTSIPRPSRRHEDTSVFLHMLERVQTVKLSPFFPSGCKVQSSNIDNASIYLSLPNPLCFTSGQTVPFSLSLVFPEEPVLVQLFARNIRIQLLKRLTLRRKYDAVRRDKLISTATLRYGREYTEGISLLRGEIRAGDAGREVSWKVDDFAEVQYVLRIVIRPPDHLVDHVPSFRHEEIFELVTDSWGSLDRELSSTGGTPTPAVGLAVALKRDC